LRNVSIPEKEIKSRAPVDPMVLAEMLITTPNQARAIMVRTSRSAEPLADGGDRPSSFLVHLTRRM
jgi:hypothetical protein